MEAGQTDAVPERSALFLCSAQHQRSEQRQDNEPPLHVRGHCLFKIDATTCAEDRPLFPSATRSVCRRAVITSRGTLTIEDAKSPMTADTADADIGPIPDEELAVAVIFELEAEE